MGEIIKPNLGYTQWTNVAGNVATLPGNQLTFQDSGIFQYTLIDVNTYFFTHFFILAQYTAGPPAVINDKWRTKPFGPNIGFNIEYGFLTANTTLDYINQGLNFEAVGVDEIEYQINLTSNYAVFTFCLTAIITKI